MDNFGDEKDISLFLHELRSPINALLAMVKKTQMNLDSKEATAEALDKMIGIASYILSLSNNFLEITKSMNNFLETKEKLFNANEIIKHCIDISKFQFSLKNIEFITNIMHSDNLFIGDQVKITQILVNLLSNAFKYTSKCGKIKLDCTYDYLNDEFMELTIIVQDNGIGMSKSFLKNIFNSFKCEKEELSQKSFGLGLYIVKTNVDMLGGTISVDSTKDVGTKFTVKIPLKISKINYDISGTSILVIDDCRITQQVLIYQLEELGARCHCESDGIKGLNTYLNSPKNFYQVIIVDYILKDATGPEIVRKIRNTKRSDAKDVVILAISGTRYNKDIEDFKNAGANDYLSKPLHRENLIELIYNYTKTDLVK